MDTREKEIFLIALERTLERGKSSCGVSTLQELDTAISDLRSDYSVDPDELSPYHITLRYNQLSALVFPSPDIPDGTQPVYTEACPAIESNDDKHYVILLLESALDAVRVKANITALADIELSVQGCRTKFDADPDTLTETELKQAYTQIRNGTPPRLNDLARIMYLGWSGDGGNVTEGQTPIYFQDNAGVLEYSFDKTTWENMFPPESHQHTEAEISDLSKDWGEITSKPEEFPPESHQHTEADISDLSKDWGEITSKPEEFPPESHQHTEADISDLSKDWGEITGKPTIALIIGNPGSHTHFVTEAAVRAALWREACIILADIKPQNSGGGSFFSGARRVRDLNTIILDETGEVSLASNQLTLPAGTYYYEGEAPGYRVNNHQAYLYNVTDQCDIGQSFIALSHVDGATQTYSRFMGKVGLTATTTFEIQHECVADFADYGFGVLASFGNSVYTYIRLWRVTHGS